MRVQYTENIQTAYRQTDIPTTKHSAESVSENKKNKNPIVQRAKASNVSAYKVIIFNISLIS